MVSINRGKERISVSIDQELLEWLDGQVKLKIFANRSHGFEYLLKRQQDTGSGSRFAAITSPSMK